MAEIINLNRARKARAKDEARATAAANRVAHGRTRGQRDGAEAERAAAARLLDGARMDGARLDDMGREPPVDDGA